MTIINGFNLLMIDTKGCYYDFITCPLEIIDGDPFSIYIVNSLSWDVSVYFLVCLGLSRLGLGIIILLKPFLC